jgi:hypothetical protein
MPFEIKEPRPGVYFLKFDTRENLGMSFLRFQENYENPHFRNKIFTMKEFKPWYKKFKNKTTFTYCTDWSGFNIPSYILDRFRKGDFDPLSKLEKQLLKAFDGKKGKFYIVGSCSDDVIFDHEIAHAMFYINPKYKKAVLGELEKYDLEDVKGFLKGKMYCNSVLNDEINAYFSTAGDSMRKWMCKRVDFKPLGKLILDLKKLYTKFLKI